MREQREREGKRELNLAGKSTAKERANEELSDGALADVALPTIRGSASQNNGQLGDAALLDAQSALDGNNGTRPDGRGLVGELSMWCKCVFLHGSIRISHKRQHRRSHVLQCHHRLQRSQCQMANKGPSGVQQDWAEDQSPPEGHLPLCRTSPDNLNTAVEAHLPTAARYRRNSQGSPSSQAPATSQTPACNPINKQLQLHQCHSLEARSQPRPLPFDVDPSEYILDASNNALHTSW